jgi:hypothetical protein
MPSILNLNFGNLSSVNGVSVNAITSVCGVNTGSTPPPPPVLCNTVSLGYSDGRRNAPSDACSAEFFEYSLNTTTNILYVSGQCNVTTAPAGYYSDGRTLFFFDGLVLETVGDCGK